MAFLRPALVFLAWLPLLSTMGFAQGAPPSWAEAKAKADPAYPLIEKALSLLKTQDIRGAATQLAKALEVNPHSVVAHVLLGSLYASKRILPQAEEQFKLAEADAPTDTSIQFFLADIKMAEGDDAGARAVYAALEKIPGHEDFAAYKVFLCDLMGGQTDQAEKELAAFKTDKPQPSYYFANAAWDVSQHDSANAQKWLNTVATAFTMDVDMPYVQALRNIGYLPLPAN
jgi:Tfp pilus assembly protein PilF